MRREPGTLTLERVFDFEEEFDEEEWIVEEVDAIRTGSRSYVFRVQIHRPAGKTLDAVLKIDPTGEHEPAYKNELEAYETKAKPLQGSALPIFYGCFQAQIGSITVTCLAMEYCGQPMKERLYEVTNPFLGEIMLSVTALHRHGLTHGDVYERNILELQGHPVLIDLESSESHTCGVRMRTIRGAMRPTVEEFGCAELHNLIWRMGFWKSDTLKFYTSFIMKETLFTVDDIKWFIPEKCNPEWRKTLEDRAEKLFEELCAERILTYGTDKLSECKVRLDYITPDDLAKYYKHDSSDSTVV